MNPFLNAICLFGMFLMSQAVISGEITENFNTGDTLTAGKINDIKSAVNDNNGRLNTLQFEGYMPDMQYTSDIALTIPEGQVVIDESLYVNLTSIGWSFANLVGPGGIDEGAETDDSWYYMYAIPDGNGFATVASLNTPIRVGGTGPTGYPEHVYLGSFYNSATGIRPFTKAGAQYEYHSMLEIYFASAQTPATAWAAVDLTDGLPVTAAQADLTIWRDDDQAVNAWEFIMVRATGTNGNGIRRLGSQHTGTNHVGLNSFSMLVPASRSIEWRNHIVVAGPIDLGIDVNGYRE